MAGSFALLVPMRASSRLSRGETLTSSLMFRCAGAIRQAGRHNRKTGLIHGTLPPAALVIMVHVDELPLLKWLVAHAAGVLLRIQQAVEVLLVSP